MTKGFLYVTIFCALLVSAYLNSPNYKKQGKTIKYLPLGDSYTIGTGAKEIESWPYLLTKHLNDIKIPLQLIGNPARNGFSTQDLIEKELPLFKKYRPDFVTLLIGVNDWVRGVSKTNYAKNLVYILNELEKQIPDRKKIMLITIPDFGVTTNGKNYGGGRNIREGISEFNEIIKGEAKKRGLPVADIFEISKKMETDNSLVSQDGLHPSAKGYALWEELILATAIKMLK